MTEDLERRVAALEARVTALEKRLSRLLGQLAREVRDRFYGPSGGG